MIGLQPQKGATNYLKGNAPDKWRQRVPHFSKVKAPRVYTGIDVTYYGSQQQLEFDLTVHPGADPRVIRLGVAGAKKVTVSPEGDVSLAIRGGEVRLRQAHIYQLRHGVKEPVVGHYVLIGKDQIGLEIGRYDRSRTLVIDPVLSYAMVFGAHGNKGDLPSAIAVDSSGNTYLTGVTCAPDFPVTPQALQPTGGTTITIANCQDGFVTKINSTATSLIYSTYLGGSAIDAPVRIAVDTTGAAYITGGTQSADFPVTPGAFDTVFHGSGACTTSIQHFHGCTDGFVTKLSPDGSSLLYSTFLGGSDVDFGLGIAVDSKGNAYIAGATNSSDFPVTHGVVQKQFGGGTCSSASCFDGFVTKLSPDGKSLIYSTYLGGSEDDYAFGIAVDSKGNVFLSGGAGSKNFPVTSTAFQSKHAGTTDQTDGFVAELNPTASKLLYSTYLGGSETDYATGLVLDSAGTVYVSGATASSDFPVTAGVFQTTFAGPTTDTCVFDLSSITSLACGDAFVARIDPALSGKASLLWSSFLGGMSNDDALDIALDSAHNVWVSGESMSKNFPLTPNAYLSGSQFGGAFVANISADGTKLLFSTLLSQSGTTDYASAVATDTHGGVHVAGIGQALAATSGVYPGIGNDFLLKFSPGLAPAVQLSATSLTFASVPVGGTSAAQPVVLKNTGKSPLSVSIATDVGLNSVNYAETDNCGSTLPAGVSCTIQVTSTPSVPNGAGGFLDIFDNAPGAPHKVSLSGNGTTPATTAVLSPKLLNFGSQAALTNSAPQTVKLKNQGTSAITISSITASGSFSKTSTCGKTLAAQATCAILVEFSPMTTGAFTGTLSIKDNAPGGLQTVSLKGDGTQGAAAFVTPTSLTFKALAPGNTSPAQNVTLSDSGNATLDMTGFLTRGEFAETHTCGTTLAPSGKCTLSVVYKPTEAGPHSGSLVIGTNADGSPQVVALTALGPQIFFTPGFLNFGSVAKGTTSPPKTLQVTNGGTSPLHISTIALGGTNPGDFAIVASGTTCHNGTVLQPLSAGATANCLINIVFKPAVTGGLTATVIFTDDAAKSPQSVNLFGTGQ